MKNRPEISLVIPTYNREKLIEETIESALNQTRAFYEIIVVDDASTDGTVTLLKKYGNRVTVIESEKIGVQRARNKGVAVASAEYITLCDSDDLLSPTYVETISAWIEKNSWCDSIYCNFNTFKADSIDPDKFSQAPTGFFVGAQSDGDFIHDVPNLYGKTVDFQPLFSSGVTINRAFYQRLGGYDSKFNGIGSEDWEYTLRALDHGRTAICMLPMVRIRRHSGNDSGNSLRQVLGEIQVLEYALANHRAAAAYRELIANGLNRRSIDAFELAFGLRRFRLASELLPDIRRKPSGLKFAIKAAFISVYSLLSEAAAPSKTLCSSSDKRKTNA